MIFDHLLTFLLILLIIFTPLARGSMEFWTFSVMELGILLLIVLWAISRIRNERITSEGKSSAREMDLISCHGTGTGELLPTTCVVVVVWGLFLGLILFQEVGLPVSWIDLFSPKTSMFRQHLHVGDEPLRTIPLSFFPYGTRTEFLTWVVFGGFFLFLLHWRPDHESRVNRHLILAILMVGAFEALCGLFGFLGVRNPLFAFDEAEGIRSGAGTFVNRNHFVGYLLMVIPLTIGFLFAHEAKQKGRSKRLIDRLSSMDGKALLISFSIIVMILALFFSTSRMGILSLFLSFVVVMILLKGPSGEKLFFRRSAFFIGAALLCGVWIGLEAVVGRFFGMAEDFKLRGMIWTSTFDMIKDFPLFGAGLGTFAQVFPMYRSFHIRGLVTHAENDFLQLASETGLLGFGLLLALFVVLFFKAVLRIRSFSARDPRRYSAIGGLVGVVAIMFHSHVERIIQVPANAFLYTMLWGFILKEQTQDMEINREEREEWT